MPVKHSFVSGKADGGDASLVRPSDWNADHVVDSLSIAQGTLTASSPFVSHTATWNNSGVVFHNHDTNITGTALADLSTWQRWMLNGVSRVEIARSSANHTMDIGLQFRPSSGSSTFAMGEWVSQTFICRYRGSGGFILQSENSTASGSAFRLGLMLGGGSNYATFGGDTVGSAMLFYNINTATGVLGLGRVSPSMVSGASATVLLANETSGQAMSIDVREGQTQGSTPLLRFRNNADSATLASVESNGVINSSVGFRVAGAATSGNVLVGNGTNFVSGQLAFSNLSGAIALGQTPLTTNGDLLFVSGGALARLPIGTDGQFLKVVSGAPAWATGGGGASAFTDLSDVPSSYVGHASKFVKVNAGETALEFVSSSAAAHDLLSGTHSDTTAATVQRGDLVVAKGATPKWERHAVGAANTFFSSDGTDPAWVGGATARSRLGVRYTLHGGMFSVFPPADGAVRYLGGPADDPDSVPGDNLRHRIIVPIAGTVEEFWVAVYVQGTLGSNESVSMTLRKNGTTDAGSSLTQTWDAVSVGPTSQTLTGFTVAKGDGLSLKMTFPTWATNPTMVHVKWACVILQDQ